MGLKLSVWNSLSDSDKDDVVTFLRGNCKIDLEHPAASTGQTGSYPISDGITRGGHQMKYGDELRIYVRNIQGIPPFLDEELRERGTKNRIGGSETIRRIMDYGNFNIGNN